MSALEWDKTGEKYYEMGVDHGVLYPCKNGVYQNGVAWNGLTAVNESSDGAEANDMYADNMLYASIRSVERSKLTIEAYQSPEEFDVCDGTAEVSKGIYIGQQKREKFGFSYRTLVSNDNEEDYYKIHIVYGATANPSEKSHSTINESPEAETLSWEVDTVPVNVTGYKPTATITIDSRFIEKENLKKVEDALYGTTSTEPKLLMPDEIIKLVKN